MPLRLALEPPDTPAREHLADARPPGLLAVEAAPAAHLTRLRQEETTPQRHQEHTVLQVLAPRHLVRGTRLRLVEQRMRPRRVTLVEKEVRMMRPRQRWGWACLLRLRLEGTMGRDMRIRLVLEVMKFIMGLCCVRCAAFGVWAWKAGVADGSYLSLFLLIHI